MLRIAICDDDREFCNQIRTYLFHYSLHSEFDIDVKIFTTFLHFIILCTVFYRLAMGSRDFPCGRASFCK